MTVNALVDLIVAVDRKQKGCAVVVTTVLQPRSGGACFGYVVYGMRERRAYFSTERELKALLRKLSK